MILTKINFPHCFWLLCDLVWKAGKPAIGGPWTLFDLNGKMVSEQTFTGKYILLYFGFTRCPDICPSEMVKVGNIMDILKTQHPDFVDKIQPIFVTVDPARDSIKALKSYGSDFHPSYTFLTGTPEQVKSMAKKYRVYVSKADETDDGGKISAMVLSILDFTFYLFWISRNKDA